MAVIGLTVGIGADTKKFNKEINKMDKAIRNTNKEVYNLSRSLQLEWDSGKFLRAQKAAQQSLEQTEVKAKALRDRLKFLEEVDGGKQSQEYDEIRSKLAQAEFQAQRFKKELQELKSLRIEEMAKKFESVGDSITKAGQAMAPFSAAAAGILAGLAKIGTSAIAAGDEIGTTAQQLNISTDALQRWRYIAQQTDVDQSSLTNGIKKIQQALGNLAAGEIDSTSDALRALGFSQEQAMGGMEENFEPIINALANMQDATMQAHYANELFGARMAANIIPLLNDGGEGLAALSAEFETFNYLTEEEVAALDAYEDVWDKVKYIFKTIKDQVGLALLPTFQAFADVLQNQVAPTVQKLADWFTALSQSQKNTILGSLTFVAALAPMLLMMGKITSGIGGAIKSISGLSKALTFLSAHPIILVIGIVIGLMALLYKRNQEFKNSIDGLFQALSSMLMPILKVIGSLFTNLLSSLMPLVNILLNIAGPILTVVAQGLTFIVNLISKMLVPYIEFLGKVWGKIFGFIPEIVQTVVDSVEWMVNSVIGWINGLIDKVNNVSKYIGIELDKIDDIDINLNAPNWDTVQVEADVEEPTISQELLAGQVQTPGATTQEVLSANYNSTELSTQNNIDNSTKEYNVNVTIENYGDEIDVDDLVKKINVGLAADY